MILFIFASAMTYRIGILIWATTFFTLISCKESKEKSSAESMLSGKSVSISNTAGWLPDPDNKRSQPSNIISNNGYSYVFYVAEPLNSPISGSGYGGTIHYAFSRDHGYTWSDQGLVINKGLPEAFDGGGVSKPTVIKVTDDNFFYLYYTAVPIGFNNQDGSEANRSTIGMAKLIFNEGDGAIRLAIKLNGGKAVIEPSEINSGRFDAFRIDAPNAINLNGQAWIYYTGYDKFDGVPRTGLVISADINASHIKQNNVRALLDGIPSLIQKQNVGVLSVFTDTQNAWYAEDGLHFSKLRSKFPTAMKFGRANGDQLQLTWGLSAPINNTPGFARWEIK